MQPEDIDQLFRDRLAGHAPTPPDHLWRQLQPEIQPVKKRPPMWLYAAAAAVALLLLVGGGWLLRPGAAPAPGPLATTQPARITTPAAPSVPTSPTPQKLAEAQATAPTELASTPANALAQELAAPTRRTPAQTAPVNSSRPKQLVARQEAPQTTAVSATRKAAVLLPTRPERLAVTTALVAPTAALPRTLTTAPMPTGPIVVEVRREAPAPTLAAAEAPADRPRRSRLGAVLRQAHNVVSGQPVDLHQVGLPEALTVQARVGNHTLTKTLEL